MKDGPVIASVAALIGDPARANMLAELMHGQALTVSELAEVAGITLQTASGHLAKLDAAKLVDAVKQGRHRYFRLSGSDVADALEALMGLAERTHAVRTRRGPRDPALRQARICYDHLAGERGVALLEGLKRRGYLAEEKELALTRAGHRRLAAFGIALPVEKGRRPLCKLCLDWSERRSHLGGALGAALLDGFLAKHWLSRGEGRVLTFTRNGLAEFDAAFGGR